MRQSKLGPALWAYALDNPGFRSRDAMRHFGWTSRGQFNHVVRIVRRDHANDDKTLMAIRDHDDNDKRLKTFRWYVESPSDWLKKSVEYLDDMLTQQTGDKQNDIHILQTLLNGTDPGTMKHDLVKWAIEAATTYQENLRVVAELYQEIA